ncbi:MAG: isocitrate/isopropylmalate family dehydrogenase, partial [Pyrinomonadaceae bacterium]
MKLKITTLPGDGIGPEVTNEAVRILRVVEKSFGHEFELSECAIGGSAINKFGTPLPDATLEQCRKSDAVFLGAVGSPEHDHLPSNQRPEAGLLSLRKELGAFANLRPSICFDGLDGCSPLKSEIISGADILIVRELLG